MTHNVNQFQVFSCEQQSIEIVCVQFLVFLFVFQSLKIRKEDIHIVSNNLWIVLPQ